MGSLVDAILNVNPLLAYTLVGLLVFAEDALFFGFVLPGETAAVLGGVVAEKGHVQLWLMIVIVVLAAIIGDSVGYEVGKRFGPRLLRAKFLERRRKKLDDARSLLQRRGAAAVFLGRFVAFFRAVMPALAGTSRMPYGRFLAFNAAGGLTWGVVFVVLGFVAGNSYELVAKTVGRDLAVGVIALLIVGFIVLRLRRRARERRAALTAEGAPVDEQ